MAKVAERLVEQGLAVDPARERGVREADGFEAATAMLAAILGVTAVIWSAVTGGPWHWLRPLLAFALLLCGWGVLHVLRDPRPRTRGGSAAGRALCARAVADDSWEPRPDHATRLPARTRRTVAEASRHGLDAVTLPALALAVVGGPRPVPEPPVRAAEDAGGARSRSSPPTAATRSSPPVPGRVVRGLRRVRRRPVKDGAAPAGGGSRWDRRQAWARRRLPYPASGRPALIRARTTSRSSPWCGSSAMRLRPRAPQPVHWWTIT